MLTQTLDTTADFAVALLIHYSFDLGGCTAGELIDRWLNDYPANWVRLAVIEALYQGRYKAISVEQILAFWNRRGQAIYHFNHEFERLICGNFPQMTGQSDTRANPSPPASTAVGLGNEHDDPAVVTTKQAALEKTPVQRFDATANVPPSTRSAQSHSSASNPSIEQFTPQKTYGSDFYTKLKAIAHSDRACTSR